MSTGDGSCWSCQVFPSLARGSFLTRVGQSLLHVGSRATHGRQMPGVLCQCLSLQMLAALINVFLTQEASLLCPSLLSPWHGLGPLHSVSSCRRARLTAFPSLTVTDYRGLFGVLRAIVIFVQFLSRSRQEGRSSVRFWLAGSRRKSSLWVQFPFCNYRGR